MTYKIIVELKISTTPAATPLAFQLKPIWLNLYTGIT
jgi:hypothetical protein